MNCEDHVWYDLICTRWVPGGIRRLTIKRVSCTQNGDTALFLAISRSYPEVVMVLIAFGADVNVKGDVSGCMRRGEGPGGVLYK